ncbi:MAG TPA: response regulator [Caldisericia bacterium]|nr:response regulator [Caldisericia bacterium]HPF49226.1 response regulator [Caldisericia bacterium]HPI84094.1 response regulator [Caldisericia bacterium]HPQ93352.1 response regulator [Caldisericia bacterium]HRV75266.1 response regulator [Caldisericia bacterium]
MYINKGQIMIIDDSPPVVNVIKTVLEGAGYEVNAFESAQNALMDLSNGTPDLIICDILMPEMDGFEFRKALTEDKRTAHIPFIFLTARDDLELMIKGLSSGIIDYFTKPIKPKELLEHIGGVMDNMYSARQRLLDRILVERRIEKATFDNVERVLMTVLFTGGLYIGDDVEPDLAVFYNRGRPFAAKGRNGETGHDAYKAAENIKGEFIIKDESVAEIEREF